ncbi:S41 family peptidase [Clostridium sp.]|jgi:carboxyl-terminal processing protease|uniref:S41 family peptidase n=1 Tax=Clostridium sp. TaxID=1506 RepID=UPI0039F4FEA5
MNDSNGKIKSRDSKIIWILIGVLILILTNFATYIIGTRMPIKGTRRISEKTYENLVQFNKLFIVKENLNHFYDGKIDEEALVDGAIKGMTESLKDPYTVYMNAKEFKEFSTETEGNYVGLGLQVAVKDDKVVVIAPFEDSPAKKAGILSGDIIEKVDGKEVTGKEYEKAVAMMRGEKNTYVTLTITREGKGTFDVKVKREEITLTTVTGEMIDNGIGYVQITMFDEHTDEQFNKVTKDLKKKGMKAMVLDLRQNPGGWLTQSINITSQFVPKDKVIVSTEDKNGNKEEYKSKGGDLIGMPLVVLTDGGTASASEIFSGAIRDYNLGTLVGENTFGKGIVQSVLYEKKYGFGDGTALKVTTSKYYTPKGENIHHKGIKPNIEVKYPKELSEKPYDKKTDPQFIKALEVIKEKVK